MGRGCGLTWEWTNNRKGRKWYSHKPGSPIILKQPRQRRKRKDNWFYEQYNSSARASRFFDAHCTTMTWNLQMRRFAEDVNIRRRIFLPRFWTWIKSLGIKLQEKSPTWTNWAGNRRDKFQRTQVFLAMVRLGFHCCSRCLSCMQTDATTSNIVAPTMLGVVVCVLAVVCKRMQQLPTMLGSAVHRGKDTTHKSL